MVFSSGWSFRWQKTNETARRIIRIPWSGQLGISINDGGEGLKGEQSIHRGIDFSVSSRLPHDLPPSSLLIFPSDTTPRGEPWNSEDLLPWLRPRKFWFQLSKSHRHVYGRRKTFPPLLAKRKIELWSFAVGCLLSDENFSERSWNCLHKVQEVSASVCFTDESTAN